MMFPTWIVFTLKHLHSNQSLLKRLLFHFTSFKIRAKSPSIVIQTQRAGFQNYHSSLWHQSALFLLPSCQTVLFSTRRSLVPSSPFSWNLASHPNTSTPTAFTWPNSLRQWRFLSPYSKFTSSGELFLTLHYRSGSSVVWFENIPYYSCSICHICDYAVI